MSTKIVRQPNSSQYNSLPPETTEMIQELASLGARDWVGSEGSDSRTREQMQEYFSLYLKQRVAEIDLQLEELEEYASFTKLLDSGCEPAQLAFHLSRCKGVPTKATPAWEDLLPTTSRRGLVAYVNDMASFAHEVQVFISRGGLGLAPDELVVELEKLPDLLLRFAEVLLCAHRATDKRRTSGPGGLDATALRALATYVRSCTGRTCAELVTDLLTVVSGRDVDERAYRRFLKGYLDN